jgi:hypothetical protein
MIEYIGPFGIDKVLCNRDNYEKHFHLKLSKTLGVNEGILDREEFGSVNCPFCDKGHDGKILIREECIYVITNTDSNIPNIKKCLYFCPLCKKDF